MQDLIQYFIQNPTALYIAVGLLVYVSAAFECSDLPHAQDDGTGMAYRLPDVPVSGTVGD